MRDKPRTLVLSIRDGRIVAIYDDDLVPVLEWLGGQVTIRRASHVEPAPGGWVADLSPVGGPMLGAFRLRGEALEAERRWLEAQLEGRMI